MPTRFADIGDPWEGMDDAVGRLDRLLDLADRLGPAEKAPKGAKKGTGRRESVMPLIEIARTKTKDEAMAALDDWRGRYPSVAKKLEPADILRRRHAGAQLDLVPRSGSTCSTCPKDQRPPQEPLLADYNPWENYSGPQWMRGG